MIRNCVQAWTLATALFAAATAAADAQDGPAAPCPPGVRKPACEAVRGDRAEGWSGQSRSEVMARNGIVATSQPLAAQAGLDIMRRGGNAIDAAVAAAAVLSVVEPMNTGVAGDLFALIYVARENRTYALNASGTAPTGATLARMNELGYRAAPDLWGPGIGMPAGGVLTVTVPGTVWGWQEALRRFGRRGFKDVLQPAVDYAERGFPVSQRVAAEWSLPNALPLRRCCTDPDPDSLRTWYIDGEAPRAGQMFRNPGLARTLRLLQRDGSRAFYRGEIARAIVAKTASLGGSITLADLASFKGEWVQPVSTVYRGHEVLELPPPSQGWAANQMLNILETCVQEWSGGRTLGELGPRSAQYWHFLVEAKKLAYRDLYASNADPDFTAVPIERLLSRDYARSLCARVDPGGAGPTAAPAHETPAGNDTIVLVTGDREGNMVSWVNSNYAAFGSGITVPGYGFVLHNRGALFSLDPASPNVIAPRKRPFNTLAAGFVLKDRRPVLALTLMGGDMQAQGHAQALVNLLDLGANVQAASDMARFRHSQLPDVLALESELFRAVGTDLRAMGHRVAATSGAAVGGYQAVMFVPGGLPGPGKLDGHYRAGSDHRKDGHAVGW